MPLYMGTIAAALLIAADKYLLDGLKMICENYLLRYISPGELCRTSFKWRSGESNGAFEGSGKVFLALPNSSDGDRQLGNDQRRKSHFTV